MRILHVVTTLDVGGAEMHLLAQVRGQVERGHEPSLAWLKGEGRLAPDFREAGAREVEPLPRGPALPFALAARMRRAELVHSHLLKADALCALVAPLAGRASRLVSGKHNDERALLRPAVARVHALLARVPRRTIVLSDHVGRFFVQHGGVPPERVRRVYYGLDPAPFERALEAGPAARAATRAELGLAPETVAFVCVARFAAQKAHDVLLRAFAAARARAGAPPMALLLVGDDPFGDGRARAEALARELALGESVRFLGIRRDVPALCAASDAFVMASLWEGLGLVFLEAMAARLPVLATQVSAVPEVVLEGETGLLVPAAEVEPLAEALLELARDPELRARLGRAGSRRVRERFGLARMIDETLAVYGEVLAGAPPAPAAGVQARGGAAR